MKDVVLYYCASGDEDQPTATEINSIIELFHTEPTREELIEQMHYHQQKATEILIRLNESPSIQVGEIPAPLWTSHCDGQGE